MTEHFSVGEVLRRGLPRYHDRFGPLPKHIYRVVNALMACRTDAAGAHRNKCPNCGHIEIAYNSCRNRHCPRCQAHKAKEWTQARIDELLPLPYFHIVFTVPHELNPMALQNKECFYRLMFRAVSETLTELGADTKRLGGKTGFFAVLHTWTQTLVDHPHIHVVIPGGGIAPDSIQFKRSRPDYIFPVKVMAALYKGKLLAYLKSAVANQEIRFHGLLSNLKDPLHLKSLWDILYNHAFVVYAKKPFAGPEQVLHYLGRYTHRVAISDRRIVSITEDSVSFTWRDRADNGKQKTMCLDIAEFIRRFLMHLLPQGFVKIRYFGFMANAFRKKALKLCVKLLAEKAAYIMDNIVKIPLPSITPRLCPCCNQVPMLFDRLVTSASPG